MPIFPFAANTPLDLGAYQTSKNKNLPKNSPNLN